MDFSAWAIEKQRFIREHIPEFMEKQRFIRRQAPVFLDCLISGNLRLKPRYMPVLLAFVTDKCNLKCQMCGVYKRPKPPMEGMLSTDEWKDIIRRAAALRAIIVSFTGGEPLLRDDIFDLIACARESNIAVHVCTNGTLIDADMASELQKAGANTVSVSLESVSPVGHDKLRGDGTFERTLEGIRCLLRHAPKVNVGINTLLTALNISRIGRMVKFAENLGVDQVKFAPIHVNLQHKPKSLASFSHLVFDEQSINELRKEVRFLLRASRRTGLQTTSTQFLRGIPNLYIRPERFKCFAGYATCSVGPYGRVSPCFDMLHGISVRDMPLDKIWKHELFQLYRTQVHRCRRPCWDTTNAELSLRLSPFSLFRDVCETIRDIEFYFSRSKH